MLQRLGSRFIAVGLMWTLSACGGGGGGSAADPGSTGSNGAAGATTPASSPAPASSPTPASSPAPASSPSSASDASATTPKLAAATPVIDGTTLGAAIWPAGVTSSGGTGQPVSGLNCGLRSTAYTYAHLSIYQNGQLLTLPPNIGMVEPTLTTPTGCAYPVHTVDSSGKIHMDATTGATYTLGQFFSIWGETLSASNVAGLTASPIAIYVNDGGTLTQYTGDPASLVLKPHTEITVMVGTPVTQVPTYTWTDPPPVDPNPITLVFGGVVGSSFWPNGTTSTGGTGTPVDGLTCAPDMSVLYHVHAHLAIIKDGQWLALPMNVGILSQCTYEMHTHDNTGIIHIEAPNLKTYTLGEFFDIWGEPLTNTNVAGIMGDVVAYINDNGDSRRYMGDLRSIELTSLRDITLQIGTPPVSTLATYSWYEPQ
ncbi:MULTISPECIES: hypothetical protein [unclassified Paraburkholderia]|uniref:hypothetical protein n=1 Tax=unclassified Paraburkholderia TaxID=2615204 RepID=UPI00161224EC|nr:MULTISPECIES: hypothetical protein [unclassified Paraburkholderia]MBB5444871.1 hypothetical protein [Paraburkholderia sp. WSM4177]